MSPPPKSGILNSEFSGWLDGYVKQMIQLHRMARPAPRTADIWRCKNLGDFMCGFFVGEVIGAATTTFQAKHGREPSADEHVAIAGIVEGNARDIRDAFLKYN